MEFWDLKIDFKPFYETEKLEIEKLETDLMMSTWHKFSNILFCSSVEDKEWRSSYLYSNSIYFIV